MEFAATFEAQAYAMILSIPESLGLLAVGVLMAATAVMLRGFLGRRDLGKKEGHGADEA